MTVPPLAQWSVKRFRGAAPARRWLVDRVVPLGCAGLLATQGDAGKGMMMLDLALKVAGPPTVPPPSAFGREVLARGGAVILCGEDDEHEVHRRLDALDPGARRRPLCKDFYILPALSLDKPMVLTGRGDGAIEAGEDWLMLAAQLQKIPDLKLIVLDPLHGFSRDTADAGALMALCARLAQRHGAAVVLTHELPEQGAPIATPQDAGEAMRRSGVMANALRWVYAIWPLVRDQALRAQKRYAVDGTAKLGEPTLDTWYGGALLRPSTGGAREPAIWQRDHATGLLKLCDDRDPTMLIRQARDALLLAIGAAWDADRPLQRRSAKDGLWPRRAELAPVLRGLGRNGLIELCEELIERGEIKMSRPQGGPRAFYLRLPESAVTRRGVRPAAG